MPKISAKFQWRYSPVAAPNASSVLFCSLTVLDPKVGHTMNVHFLHLSMSFVILIDSSTASLVHVLMLSIQAVRGLPRLRAPGILLCITVSHCPDNSFVSSWCDHSTLTSLL